MFQKKAYMNWVWWMGRISLCKDSGRSIPGRRNSMNKHTKVEISRIDVHVTVRLEFKS